MATPQLILTLDAGGKLAAELPGTNGSRRKVELAPKQSDTAAIIASAIDVLKVIIRAKEDGAGDPTEPEELRKIAASLTGILNKDETLTGVISHILNKQVQKQTRVSEDGAPTEAQVKHWRQHGIATNVCELCRVELSFDPKAKLWRSLDDNADTRCAGGDALHKQTFALPEVSWSDPSCPFCIAEGRFIPGKNRERAIKGLTPLDAIKLGLKSRGFREGPQGTWARPKSKARDNVYVTPTGKVLSHNKTQFSAASVETLIADGKAEARRTNWSPDKKVLLKREGVVVKTLTTAAGTAMPRTKAERMKKNLKDVEITF